MSRLVRRWLARVLIAGGAILLMWVAGNLVLAMSNRRQYEAAFERMRSSPAAAVPVVPVSLPAGAPIGTLELVRVGLSGVVVEGDDDSVLASAIGHLPDTPLPWHTGNSALAAHRDALFRPLRDARPGDVLGLRTLHATSTTSFAKP